MLVPGLNLTYKGDGAKHFATKKILSEAAVQLIKREIKAGTYSDRAGEREPPFMAPSSDPEDYPRVC